MKSRTLTIAIVVALVAGIAVGTAVHSSLSDASIKSFAETVSLLTTVFLRLIRMIIAPLVFSTLVAGIAGMRDVQTVGRIGGKTLLWFLSISSLSITLGMVLVALFQPGVGSGLSLPDAGAASGVPVTGFTLSNFIEHLVPKSIVEAMANNEILQIVVFSLFFGTAMLAVGERAKPLLGLIATVSQVMLTVTNYVMMAAPLAVFGAVAAILARQGLGAISTYATLMAEFFFGIALLWVVLIVAGYLVIGHRVFRLLVRLREPILLAFSTASSESAYPKTLEELERFGCSNKVASFVLPMGYSFNLDGSMMYCAFAVIFLAQAYGVEVGFGQAFAVGLTLMVTTKGIAGVPRAGLVVIAATLPMLGVPETALLLLIGIDQFFDMARTATNVLGNGVATAVVSRWENELGPEQAEDATLAAVPLANPA
jgi:Na+/H+-dicarboxylate symporter